MLKRLPYLHRPFPPSFSQCRFTETDSKTISFAEKILTSQALDPSREQDEKGVDFRTLKIYPEKRKKTDRLEKRKPVFFDKAVVEVMLDKFSRITPSKRCLFLGYASETAKDECYSRLAQRLANGAFFQSERCSNKFTNGIFKG